MRSLRDRVLSFVIVTATGCGSVERSHLLDAAIDGSLDSDMSIRYDVGYINEFTLTPSTSSLFSFLLVVNKGGVPLNTLGISVVSFISDNPGVDWTFSKESDATKTLPSGRAAGALSPAAMAQIVDSGLVTESIDDPFLNFRMSFPSAPPAGITLRDPLVL
jgi:hypothetical protein